YKAMAAEYKKVAPNVTINMTIIQNDYQTVLKSKLNSGNIPDLFMSSAYNDNKVYQDYTYDLTNESFMKNFNPEFLKSVTLDNKITGYPFLVQSHSFIYNKDLFKKAGITKLPTTLDDYKEVCEKLQAKGIQPFSSGFAEWWVLPQMTYPSMSDAYDGDYNKLFSDIKSGKLKFGDLPQVDFALDLIDLVKKYSGSKPMESTADMQVSDFANGKVAMIHQGSWEEDSIRKINKDIDMGYLEAPRMDGKSVIAVDSNLTMRVSKDSKNLKEVLSFLDWLTTSDYGKSWIPEVVKQISPQKDAASPDTQLAKETAKAVNDGKTCQWWIFCGPDGIEQPFGTAFQNYAAGASRQQTKDNLTKIFVDAYNAES
ncbi:MAG: extracellular solute-binding protein, partial [[Clostridium] cellulosi]